MPSKILILSLHRIGFPPPNARIRGLFTTPRLLKFQLRFLKMLGYRFATLRDALQVSDGKVAVVTFDDGYADNFTEGLPVLQRLDIPATVFVITGDVGARQLSWDEAGEKLPADFMSWDDLRVLSACGWEIGSHAHSHIHLARYAKERQQYEIVRSVREIEENLGETPVSFAYPYGSYDQRTMEVLRQTGIKNAVTIKSPTANDLTDAQCRLELSRVSIGGRNLDHYFKSIFRTLKATGVAGLVPRPQMASNFPAVSEPTMVVIK